MRQYRHTPLRHPSGLDAIAPWRPRSPGGHAPTSGCTLVAGRGAAAYALVTRQRRLHLVDLSTGTAPARAEGIAP